MSACPFWLVFTLSSALLLAAGSGAGGPCVDTEMTRLPSDDGSRDAVTFIRPCGDSTEHLSGVAIVPKGQPVPDKPDSVLILGHAKKLVARWLAPDTFMVVSPSANASPQERRMEGVRIIYKRP